MAQRDQIKDWRTYYEKTGARPPRETLIFALDRFDQEGRDPASLAAVDLGSGSGRDTVEILRRGWSVLAIDAELAAIEALKARPDLPPDARLSTMVHRFETAKWPAVDLVNSSFALPLCPPDTFPEMWRRIQDSLHPGGRVSCQLYGDRDSWAGDPTITFLDRGTLDAMLKDLAVEHFREEEDDSVTPRGTPKHWHIYHLVARKPS